MHLNALEPYLGDVTNVRTFAPSCKIGCQVALKEMKRKCCLKSHFSAQCASNNSQYWCKYLIHFSNFTRNWYRQGEGRIFVRFHRFLLGTVKFIHSETWCRIFEIRRSLEGTIFQDAHRALVMLSYLSLLTSTLMGCDQSRVKTLHLLSNLSKQLQLCSVLQIWEDLPSLD